MRESIRNIIILSLVLVAALTAVLSCATPQVSELEDKTWLSPGKIQVSNVLPGNHIKQSITIHNGSDVATTFLVYYRIPDYVEDNFVVAPDNVQDWIKIGEKSPVVQSGETKDIQVILDLPSDAQTPERWEFWIGVKENKQGSLAMELGSRWLVTMKGN